MLGIWIFLPKVNYYTLKFNIMEDYEKLVERNQSGEIDDLEFLLAQEDLAELYINDLQAKGISPNAENAAEWLLKYEQV